MASKKAACVDAPKRSRSPLASEAEMFGEFQDWCLRTYGDSGKTKTVTRRKYNKIMQTLLQNDEADGVYVQDNSHINAKFKFWVKSKGFQVGAGVLGEHNKKGAPGKPVLYVPVKSTCSDGNSAQDNSSLKRVAVVEDFFDIIYAMHVEIGADPGRAPKHAGQKKTYKAIAETYAFLPREAVTRFLMSCGECQKRMHINPSAAEFKENDRPTSLVPDLIDYNMPLTATYLKQMKLQCMTATERDDSSVSSEDTDGAEPVWAASRRPVAVADEPAPPNDPPPAVKEEDDEVSSESSGGGGGNGIAWPPDGGATYGEPSENGSAVPLDFSGASDERRLLNPSERRPQVGSGSSSPPPSNSFPAEPGRKYPLKSQYAKSSPPYSYDSARTEAVGTDGNGGAEDLSSGRAAVADDDDDDHDDDGDKLNDVEGMDPERLKAFNMFVRLFVDENLDRMVPISKQPKEKIQAIMESCGRQFPEFQERSRKRIRTYLKSCRRMKKSGFEIRPTPPHLTSAMAENILAAACESETRNAAKRMRLDVYPAVSVRSAGRPEGASVPTKGAGSPQDEAAVPPDEDPPPAAPSGLVISAAAFAQDQLYANGGLNYNLRAYGPVAANRQNAAPQSNGPTDLSMKSAVAATDASSSNSYGQGGGGGGGGGASAQLSPPEVTAVRQLIAGYRESAAFLLRSADELENLILQQN
ncbi:nucleolar protein 4-like isoform X2 [Corythoichthys intestinalis]|uniref:nucleolar protein 4-like isoform X2 n=1 Tax=Corythoichthys intestinalis TaxID=161448 RepID=UPI0025A594D3|nr:nucleolar protein 4-like isoform X2 [Corythoichthys intestinalis]